jgi:phosphoglycerate dehydrogenase-like enzyme
MFKKTIVIPTKLDLYPDQKKRLESFGNVKFFQDSPITTSEWLKRCSGADIICSGKFGLTEKIYNLKNVFISLPFVDINWLNKNKLKKRNISISYAPGCNSESVVEWIMSMIIILLRDLYYFINKENINLKFTPRKQGLKGKKVTILGKGNIGLRIGILCELFGMQVNYFTKANNLYEVCKQSDLIINCLSLNKSTINILDLIFFKNLKKGVYFISIAQMKTFNLRDLIYCINNGTISNAAIDIDSFENGDKLNNEDLILIKNSKIIATPHIAHKTDVNARIAYDMMIDNVEAWILGKPLNIL